VPQSSCCDWVVRVVNWYNRPSVVLLCSATWCYINSNSSIQIVIVVVTVAVEDNSFYQWVKKNNKQHLGDGFIDLGRWETFVDSLNSL